MAMLNNPIASQVARLAPGTPVGVAASQAGGSYTPSPVPPTWSDPWSSNSNGQRAPVPPTWSDPWSGNSNPGVPQPLATGQGAVGAANTNPNVAAEQQAQQYAALGGGGTWTAAQQAQAIQNWQQQRFQYNPISPQQGQSLPTWQGGQEGVQSEQAALAAMLQNPNMQHQAQAVRNLQQQGYPPAIGPAQITPWGNSASYANMVGAMYSNPNGHPNPGSAGPRTVRHAPVQYAASDLGPPPQVNALSQGLRARTLMR